MLQDKIAIVTGGGSGIGQAAALIMAREGAKVVVADISEHGGLTTVRDIQARGGESFFCATDVTREDQVVNLIDATVQRYGRLDCACNNAGFGNRMALMADLEVGDWAPVLNLCLLSTFMCMKYEIAAMLETFEQQGVDWSAAAADIPLGRQGTSGEVGELMAWLCSERASYVTGQSISHFSPRSFGNSDSRYYAILETTAGVTARDTGQ